MSVSEPPAPSSAMHGRALILAAAVLWSLNGVFNTILTKETALGLHLPNVQAIHIAFYRALFAGLVLLPGIRRTEITFRRSMIWLALAFAAMNVCFVLAMTKGDVAKALFLQYTAPMWTSLIAVFWLKEALDRRTFITVLIALAGVGVIAFGGWRSNLLPIVALASASGFFYAFVIIGLKVLKSESSRWLTIVNFLVSALVLLLWVAQVPVPTWPQFVCLALYGSVQLALPYVLLARGLRSVNSQEAACLTLIEPLLAPLWAWLVATHGQPPALTDVIGGIFIIGALLWRYVPRRPAASDDAAHCQPPKRAL